MPTGQRDYRCCGSHMKEWCNPRKSLPHGVASPLNLVTILPADQLCCEAYIVGNTAVNDVSPRFLQIDVEPPHDLLRQLYRLLHRLDALTSGSNLYISIRATSFPKHTRGPIPKVNCAASSSKVCFSPSSHRSGSKWSGSSPYNVRSR